MTLMMVTMTMMTLTTMLIVIMMIYMMTTTMLDIILTDLHKCISVEKDAQKKVRPKSAMQKAIEDKVFSLQSTLDEEEQEKYDEEEDEDGRIMCMLS